MSVTDRVRTWNMILLSLTVVGTLVAWIFFDRAPNDVSFLVGSLIAGTAVGEASANKKRQTYAEKDVALAKEAAVVR